MKTRYFFNACQLALIHVYGFYSRIVTAIKFKCYDVDYRSFTTTGVPFVHVSLNAQIVIGKRLMMGNSLLTGNGSSKCRFDVRGNAVLTIGDNVGMNQVKIRCSERITIGNDVKIGVGTCIFDTDFHSLDASIRC